MCFVSERRFIDILIVLSFEYASNKVKVVLTDEWMMVDDFCVFCVFWKMFDTSRLVANE